MYRANMTPKRDYHGFFAALSSGTSWLLREMGNGEANSASECRRPYGTDWWRSWVENPSENGGLIVA